MKWKPWPKIAPLELASYANEDSVRICNPIEGRDDLLKESDGTRLFLNKLYEALVRRNISYAPEKYFPAQEYQRVRDPYEILESPREGTCLDLSLLFCGLCLGYGLLPLLIILDGHALAAVSLERLLPGWRDQGRKEIEDFKNGFLENPQPLKDMIDLGQYLIIECTGFARSKSLHADKPEEQGREDSMLTFEKAVQVGRQQLEDVKRPFRFALDVAWLQYNGIEPLPLPDYTTTNARVFFGVPPAPDNFLGRDELFHTLKQKLLTGGQQFEIIIQIPGVGKTGLAAALANDEDIIKHFSDGVLWAGLGREPDAFALLGSWAGALGIPASDLANLKCVEDRAKAIHDKIGLSRILLVVDDAWQSDKMLAFKVGGPNCALLVTTRIAEVASEFAGKEIHVIHELSEEDGLDLLARLAPDVVKVEPIEAKTLVREVGALPQALTILGRYLHKESLSGMPGRIKATLKKLLIAQERQKVILLKSPVDRPPGLPPDTPLSLKASIRISDDALDEESQRTLRALSVFRSKPGTFSEEAAVSVTGATTETLYKLVDAGLLESKGAAYEMPRTIADYAGSNLSAADTEKYHRLAIAYYSRWLKDYEDERKDITPYARMYSYEDPEWQKVKSEWLFHLTFSSDRISANIAFARVYLDAFWWWGGYRQFPFCERLLREWDDTQFQPEDREWLRLLRKFSESYPAGAENEGKGNWQDVAEAVLEMRKRGGLEGDISQLDYERCHVRAITNLFLGVSLRNRQPHDTKADEYYNEALLLFKEGRTCDDDDDAWNIPWTLWYLGDLYFVRGEGNKVLATCMESMKLAMAPGKEKCDWDYEVISNNYRLRADVFWQHGDLNLAFGNYELALFYAYIFQGYPEPPDLYTLDFYREMVHRTLERLNALWEGGRKPEALQMCQQLRDFWAPYWKMMEKPEIPTPFEVLLEGKREQDLAACLFPPPPTEQEIALKAPEYVRQVAKMAEEFAGCFQIND